MGSTGSRPKLFKVAPCNSLQEGAQPEPQWTVPALPVSVEQPSGSLAQKKKTLPPLRQEITLSTLSGNIPSKQSNNSSIIHSHPPRRMQTLQPLALQIGHTRIATQIAMGRDCRDGGVPLSSTIGQTGSCGTSRMIQGGFLEAQTALTQQAHRQRRAHHRQARKQRRHKVVSVNGPQVEGPNTEGIQRLKLVRSPTERDIFWDETTGDRLDPSCLLDPTFLRHLCEGRQRNQPNKEDGIQGERGPRNREEKNEHTGQRCPYIDKNILWTNEREMVGIEDRDTTQRDGYVV
ncbi:hypothetical protein KUCAC02_025476 [Chaenocephalus aceratus]|uniref:Uncharacterized protein n=1 Tax=Chaenocephalus aceratus TaxID=36190 RepID=A0ACB9VVF2_CHAAC|nr:hypothetical protein KUCAC02_025476 [Chaenocephalus aceratus]